MHIDKLMKEVQENVHKKFERENKVIRSVPMTEEEKEINKKGIAMLKEIGSIMQKMDEEKERLHAMISLRLDNFQTDMRINPRTEEIDFIEEIK